MIGNDPVAAALAWADLTMNERLREARRTGTDGDYDDKIEWCIDTLAAEVRRLQADVASWQHKELVRGSCCTDNEQRAGKAEAALAALKEQHAEDVEHAFAAGVTFTATHTDQIGAGLRKWPEY